MLSLNMNEHYKTTSVIRRYLDQSSRGHSSHLPLTFELKLNFTVILTFMV